MIKRLFLSLLMALAIGSAGARFKGAAPEAGQQYYLLNVYQGKFLTIGNTLATAKQGTPALFATTSATSITVNGTAYTIEPCDNGYMLKNGGRALMFDGGGYIHDDATGKDFLNVPNAGVGVHQAEVTNRTTADCALWLFVTADEYDAMQAKKTFTTCALNVDGMPSSVKVAGLYEVKLNDDAKEGPGATAIGAKIRTLGYDVVGLSEDFNYHTEIMNALNSDSPLYTSATHRGVIKAGLGAVADYVAQRTIFNTDGLGLLTRDAAASFSGESWTAWNEHNGYSDSGADGLINKGYRYYLITLADGTKIDLYILHMDAETNPGDNAARESQMQQLAAAIKSSSNGHPIIVMGDTNCRYTRDPLKTKFIDLIDADPRFTCHDVWIEMCRDGIYPAQNGNSIMVGDNGYRLGEVVDKVFYINNTESDIRIVAEQFRQDISFVGEDGYPLADHWPMVTEFSYHAYDPAIDDVQDEAELPDFENVYLRNRATGWFLKHGGWWGTHAVQGTYGTQMYIHHLPNGKYNLNSTIGGVSAGDPYMDGESAAYTMLDTKDGYYIFAYDDNGTRRALTGNDAYMFKDEYGPNKRYVTTAVLDANDRYQQWEVLTWNDLIDEAADATPQAPYNLTHTLLGANFDVKDAVGLDMWQGFNDLNSATRMTYNRCDGNLGCETGNTVAEVFVSKCPKSHWNSCDHGTTWDINQRLENLPDGNYIVKCQGFQRLSTGTGTDSQIELYAGDESVVLAGMYSVQQTSLAGANEQNGYKYPNSMAEASQFFAAGYYVNQVPVTVAGGTLTLGVRKTSSTSSKNDEVWACFDNFQLLYLGPDVTTTVQPASAVTADSQAYTLTGIRLPASQPLRRGMYIINGNKVVVR